jgi:hypothetical protein
VIALGDGMRALQRDDFVDKIETTEKPIDSVFSIRYSCTSASGRVREVVILALLIARYLSEEYKFIEFSLHSVTKLSQAKCDTMRAKRHRTLQKHSAVFIAFFAWRARHCYRVM